MSRQPVTLDTLALAVSYLRAPGAFPSHANELALDVLPVVRELADSVRAIVETDIEAIAQLRAMGITPEPETTALSERAVRALAAFDTGRLPAPPLPTTEESPA